MRIVVATGIYPPDIGGPATYSKLVSEELTRRGHEVSVVTYGESEKWRVKSEQDFNTHHLTLITISRRIPKGIRHLVYFSRVLQHGARADIIFAQDPVSVGFPVACAAAILRKKFVVKIVGDYAWEQGVQRFGVGELLDDFLKRQYDLRVGFLRAIQRFVVGRARGIIVPSEYLRSVVVRWSVEAACIQVIPNSVRTPILVSKEEARKKLKLEGIIFLSVGRLVPWKGFEMLVELAGRIKNIGEFSLIILGDGPERGRLEALKGHLKASQSVFLPGAVSKEVLELYMAAADVFLLNTAYEGFSHQLLEAMIVGLPVVTTDAGGNKEIVHDGENALVAEYNNLESWETAVRRVLGDASLRQKLSENGKKLKDRYTVDGMIQALIRCFESL